MDSGSLKILLVCRAFPAHRPGGMEQHTHELAEGLAAAGHRVHLLTTPLPSPEADASLPQHESLTAIGHRPGRYDVAFFREALAAARRMHDRHGLDIIHTQGLALYPFAMDASPRVPCVGTIHGTHWNETPLDPRHPDRRRPGRTLGNLWHYKHRLATWPLWRRMLLRRPPIIVDSDFTRRELLRESRRLRPRVVPLGFDTTHFEWVSREEARALRQRLLPTADTDGPLLLSLGRLERVKGFETLIAAVADLPAEAKFTLVIAGSGPDAARLQGLAESSPHASRIHLAGRVPPEHVPMWFGAADVFLNPDQGQPAFGLVNAQALVCGTPVLASRVGAHPELVGEGDGGLLPPRDENAWRDGMASWLTNYPESDEARMQRRERAQRRFAREVMIRRVVEVYRDVVAESARR